MTWESFFTGILATFIFVLMFAVVFALRGIFQDEKTDVQNKKDKVRLKLGKDAPQTTSDLDLHDAVKIPSELAGLLPDMTISEVTIELIQRYGRSSIQIVNENGEYHIHSYRTSNASMPRILSSAEAKWLEQQIENTVNDPDDSVWQSLPGGDTMNITIKWNHGKDISLRGVKAISKYIDLMGRLRNLSEYGSKEELKEICDCCSEEQYRAWLEQQNTEFYSMEIIVDGTKQECMVRRVNEKSCEEVRFQGQTYFWEKSEAIHGLHNYDYAVEVRLNEKPYYLYYTETPNKNTTLYWTVNQITESTFEMLKHQPCKHEKIVFGRKIGQIDGEEFGRKIEIYKVLALATGRTIVYYRADDGTRNICLEKISGTVIPNDNHS